MTTGSSEARAVDWSAYLAAFHAERPGITETVLAHAHDDAGRNPYTWAAEAVAEIGTVLDLACGSAPMAVHLPGRRYLGLDQSAAELAAAAGAGHRTVRGDAARLPLSTASVDAVVISMALMLLPLDAALAEIARVLRPGGVLVATVPSSSPLPVRDWLRYARLCTALRHPGLHYPNDEQLSDAERVLAAVGLRLHTDERAAFTCELPTPAIADDLLASLYLPDVAPGRMDAGQRVVRRWVGSSITAPLRRLVATRTG